MNEDGFDKFERMGRDNIATLVPTKSDEEKAKEFRDQIIEAYKPLLEVLTAIDKAGFAASVNVAKGGLGKIEIQQLQIIRVFQVF